jgi:hypothetical protein
MCLVLVKEPGARVAINGPEDLSKFVEPLKHYSDFVPKLNMCPEFMRQSEGDMNPFFGGT